MLPVVGPSGVMLAVVGPLVVMPAVVGSLGVMPEDGLCPSDSCSGGCTMQRMFTPFFPFFPYLLAVVSARCLFFGGVSPPSLSTSASQPFLWNSSCFLFTSALLPIAKIVAGKTLLPHFTLALEPFSGKGSTTWEAFTFEVKPYSSQYTKTCHGVAR